MRKRRGAEVIRITGARKSLADDVRGRQRRYVIAMLVRTLSVIAAAALWNVERYVAIGALVLGVLLPYVAVVIANAGRENAPGLPDAYVPSGLKALPSGAYELPPTAVRESGGARSEGKAPSA
ncbi:DUF3099 domain-containing protein [Streptomyces sp. BBFR102]|uniref:DUF3099 domain-containing protein n=1 Tax=Streptomyces sp. BBFR102 TaxID=3448171 RepID=UPI003F52DC46